MKSIKFEFSGEQELLIPDDDLSLACAMDIISGRSYPFPADDDGPPVRSVVDLGAHAGEFAVMATIRWPEAVVFAYEPNPEVWPSLRANASQYKQITVEPFAVDVVGGYGELFYSEYGSVAGSLIAGQTADGQTATAHQKVLKKAMADVMLAKPDVLKLDIEGVELAVLQSVADLLPAVHRIYIEFHNEAIRLGLEQLLLPSHELAYARIPCSRQGEVMYVRRSQ